MSTIITIAIYTIVVLFAMVMWGGQILLSAWLAIRATVPRARRWLAFRRECAWCKPMRYLGGNPFAKQTTHGTCPKCVAEIKRQLDDEAIAADAARRAPIGKRIESVFATINSLTLNS